MHPAASANHRHPPRRARLVRWLCAGLLVAGAAQAAVPLADIQAQYRRGERQQALDRAEQALRNQPDDAGLRFLRAVILGDLDRPAEAIEAYEAMTQAYPELAEPYNNLAVLKAAQGRLDDARMLLEAALLRDAGYRTAQENLGDVLVRLAERAYLAAGADRGDAALQRKLRLVREAHAGSPR